MVLRDLGLICNKHIPAHFLTASAEERAALLAGLLDSDGSVSQSGWEFTNTQNDLVEAVAFLSRSLGYSATVSGPRITRGFGVECSSWRVQLVNDRVIVAVIEVKFVQGYAHVVVIRPHNAALSELNLSRQDVIDVAINVEHDDVAALKLSCCDALSMFGVIAATLES